MNLVKIETEKCTQENLDCIYVKELNSRNSMRLRSLLNTLNLSVKKQITAFMSS